MMHLGGSVIEAWDAVVTDTALILSANSDSALSAGEHLEFH